MRISINGLKGLPTSSLLHFVLRYIAENEVDILVIGMPLHRDGTPTYLESNIQEFIQKVQNQYPNLKIDRLDEAFTTHKAMELMIDHHVPKMKRRNKSMLDKVSAMVILKNYMERL